MYDGCMVANPEDTVPEHPESDDVYGLRGLAWAWAWIRWWFYQYSPLQRVLLGLIGLLVIGVIGFGGRLAYLGVTGQFTFAVTSAVERELYAAEDALRTAEADASGRGQAVDTSPGVLAARGRLILAQLEAGLVEEATQGALDLMPLAESNLSALYASATVLEASPVAEYSAMAPALFEKAATLIAAGDGELARATWAGVARTRYAAGNLSGAYDAYVAGAVIAPASTALYLEAAKVAEERGQWYDAAVAYATVTWYDAESTIAQEGLRRLETAHPDDAARAVADVAARLEGAGHEQP